MTELADVIKGLKYLHDKETWREGIMIYDDHARVRKQITKDALDLIDAHVRHMATLVSNQVMAEDTPMIVRCKDCKHKEESVSPSWEAWCNRLHCGCDLDWYCADGERGTDDG